MSLPLQRALRAPFLHTYTPAACLPSSELQTSMPLRLHARSVPPELQDSIPLYLHIHTPTSRLQSSIPPRLHARSVPPKLPSSIPLRLHVPGPAARRERDAESCDESRVF